MVLRDNFPALAREALRNPGSDSASICKKDKKCKKGKSGEVIYEGTAKGFTGPGANIFFVFRAGATGRGFLCWGKLC
jgi:hypothetical protein